ncbi:MAG: molybdopterin cofactor-binding domain-containing protein, partial [Bacillus sp. (in: firmicutes)]
ISIHGGGFGVGRMDPAGGRLSFTKEGKIEAAFGFEECGQGLLAVIETLVMEEFKCKEEDIRIVVGDTDSVPISGSSTASRATSMVWNSIQRMKETFRGGILERASSVTGIPVAELNMGPNGVWLSDGNLCVSYAELAEKTLNEPFLIVETSFNFPVSPDAVVDGSHFLYAFSSVLARVEVDLLTGKVKVLDLDQAIAAGPVVSLLGYQGQIEGGGIMALGYSLMEEAKMENGAYVNDNFDTYLIPTIQDVPFVMNVEAIEKLQEGDLYGPRGVGEIGTIAVAPAIVKAIHDATGCWVNKLPVSREFLLEQMSTRGEKRWI